MEQRKCKTCNKKLPLDRFYAIVQGGVRYHRTSCKACMAAKQKERRRQRRLKGEFWYQEATGNKRPLPFDFQKRFGTKWLKVRDHYMRVLLYYDKLLAGSRNQKARRVLRAHAQRLPKQLPYVVIVAGDEWPLISRALLLSRQHGMTDEFRSTCTYLYNQLRQAMKEAKDDYHIGE